MWTSPFMFLLPPYIPFFLCFHTKTPLKPSLFTTSMIAWPHLFYKEYHLEKNLLSCRLLLFTRAIRKTSFQDFSVATLLLLLIKRRSLHHYVSKYFLMQAWSIFEYIWWVNCKCRFTRHFSVITFWSYKNCTIFWWFFMNDCEHLWMNICYYNNCKNPQYIISFLLPP